jgi:hypothetical protein
MGRVVTSTIRVRPETAELVRQKAKERGIPIADFVDHLIRHGVPAPSKDETPHGEGGGHKSPDEAVGFHWLKPVDPPPAPVDNTIRISLKEALIALFIWWYFIGRHQKARGEQWAT